MAKQTDGGRVRRRRTDHIVMGMALMSTIFAIAAFLVSIINFEAQINDIQDSRIRSAVDTCYILNRLILSSGKAAGKLALSEKFIAQNGLRNCDLYGVNITSTRR